MSRAFVKESDDAGEPLPELAISPHPNFVTSTGMKLIEHRVAELEDELRSARDGPDKAVLARVNRDLRYWTRRRASARVVPPAQDPAVVRFGVMVTLRFADDGSERTFTLVGEDEADPARGLISFVSPLATALAGKEAGDEATVLGRTAAIVALT